jgi:hypothetical protein
MYVILAQTWFLPTISLNSHAILGCFVFLLYAIFHFVRENHKAFKYPPVPRRSVTHRFRLRPMNAHFYPTGIRISPLFAGSIRLQIINREPIPINISVSTKHQQTHPSHCAHRAAMP